jgi:N-acetyl-anhydromuramyl-L-alanine amidase AmpD
MIKIDKKKYKLNTNNYINLVTNKERIVIGNSFSINMKHYEGWLHRLGGEYKKTAHYTISTDGTIYEHVDPRYCTNLLNITDFDLTSIYILIDNVGWLQKNKDNKYITVNGYIYNKPTFDKKWRNFEYWSEYTEEQMVSLVYLCETLTSKFKLPRIVAESNVKINDIGGKYTIIYKSNIDRKYTDVNPSWDFTMFKEKLEKNE